MVVEGSPEEALRREAEDEEVARRRALPESVGYLLHVGVRHAVGVVGVGGVVDQGPRHRGGERPGIGHRGGDDGGRGGGDGDGVAGVNEDSEEG